MKYLAPLFFAPLLLLVSCGPSTEEAIRYSDHLVDLLSMPEERLSAYFDAVDARYTEIDSLENNNGTDLFHALDALKESVIQTKHSIERLESFPKSDKLKAEALKVCDHLLLEADGPLKETATFLMQPDSVLLKTTDAQRARIDKIFEAFVERDKKVDYQYEEVEKEFGKAYNFTLQE